MVLTHVCRQQGPPALHRRAVRVGRTICACWFGI